MESRHALSQEAAEEPAAAAPAAVGEQAAGGWELHIRVHVGLRGRLGRWGPATAAAAPAPAALMAVQRRVSTDSSE